MWNDIEDIFPEGGIFIDEKWISNESSIRNNIPVISISVIKKVRSMIEQKFRYVWHNNGDMECYKEYSIFPTGMIDNTSALNIYAKKIHNDFMEKKNESD